MFALQHTAADDEWSPHILETEPDHRDLGSKRSGECSRGEQNGRLHTTPLCVCVCSLKCTHAECEWLTIVTESPLKRIRLSSEWTFKITVFQSSLPGLFGLIPSTSDIWDLSWPFVTFPVFCDASNHHDVVYQPFLSRYLTPLILAVVLE